MRTSITVSEYIHFLFDAIERLFQLDLREEIVNKILSDSIDDQVNSKEYELTLESSKVKLFGYVDEYEPLIIELEFKNLSKNEKLKITEVVENFYFAFGTGATYRNTEESFEIFKKGTHNLINWIDGRI